MGPTVRGDAGLPRSRQPDDPRGAISPGPAFLQERHRSPGYVVPSPAGYSGPRPRRVARRASCVASPTPAASQVPPVVPGVRDPRSSVSEGRVPEATRFRALPTCLPLRWRPMSLPASPATRLGRLGSQPAPATLGAPSGPYGAASSEIGGWNS
ncbi:hypothetical protein ACRRTK_015254 [Alexandromys fortis]